MTYSRVDRVDLESDVEGHTVSIYATPKLAWAVCACDWHSQTWYVPAGAQWEWANHIAELVRG